MHTTKISENNKYQFIDSLSKLKVNFSDVTRRNLRLLDLLSAEPRWGEGEVCEECQVRLHVKAAKEERKHFLIRMKRHYLRRSLG